MREIVRETRSAGETRADPRMVEIMARRDRILESAEEKFSALQADLEAQASTGNRQTRRQAAQKLRGLARERAMFARELDRRVKAMTGDYDLEAGVSRQAEADFSAELADILGE